MRNFLSAGLLQDVDWGDVAWGFNSDLFYSKALTIYLVHLSDLLPSELRRFV